MQEPAAQSRSTPLRGVSTATVHQRLLRDGIENLPPSAFSFVMATGILSIACEFLGHSRLALCFFIVGIAAYLILWVLTGLRGVFYRQRVFDDLRSHAVSPGFFTIVAATGVLGRQCVGAGGVIDTPALAGGLWMLALSLWLAITYAVFTAMIVRPRKPSLGLGLNGVWLISAVATQSISVLGTQVAAGFPQYRETIMFVSLVFYLMGCMLYLNIITLIFYRMVFVDVKPADLTPPYWINMGATAITTQAGASLIMERDLSPVLAELVPYLKGFTLFFWAAGTWWVPLLIALGVWTHLVRRVPITYTHQIWGIVFPIGMYTASTHQLAHIVEIDVLSVIPEVTIYCAVLAWSLAFAGLLRRIGRFLVVEGR